MKAMLGFVAVLCLLVGCSGSAESRSERATNDHSTNIGRAEPGAALVRGHQDVVREPTGSPEEPAEPEPVDPPIDWVIVAGQSNAVGWYTPTGPIEPIPGVPFTAWTYGQTYQSTSYDDLVPLPYAYGLVSFGPERGIAERLIAADHRVAVVKAAKAGAPIDDFLPRADGTSVLTAAYDDAIARYPGARVHFVWVQGEYEGATQSKAPLYESKLRMLLDGLDTRWAPHRQYVVQLNAAFADCLYRDTVRAAQAKVVAEQPNRRLINADAIRDITWVHYDQAGQLELGGLVGDAILRDEP